MRSGAFVGVRPAGEEKRGDTSGHIAEEHERVRQIVTFARDIDAGDGVVVPNNGALLIGEIAGGYERPHAAPHDLPHARPVR